MGSSTYWAWLFPSTLIRWLGGAICPARAKREKTRHCSVKQGHAQGGKVCHQGRGRWAQSSVRAHTGASQPLKNPFPRSLLPHTKGNTGFVKFTLEQLWLNLNKGFPRSQTKWAQMWTEWQLTAALPAGYSCWIFTPAESLYFSPSIAYTKKIPSILNSYSFSYQLLALFCCLPSVLIQKKKNSNSKRKMHLINGQLEKSCLLMAAAEGIMIFLVPRPLSSN